MTITPLSRAVKVSSYIGTRTPDIADQRLFDGRGVLAGRSCVRVKPRQAKGATGRNCVNDRARVKRVKLDFDREVATANYDELRLSVGVINDHVVMEDRPLGNRE
jgi:hypothetical protein